MRAHTRDGLRDLMRGHDDTMAVMPCGGKVILLGEHSVVYGEPGIAVPLLDMRLSVVLAAAARSWVPAGADSEPMRPPSPDGVVNSDQVETLAMPVVGSPEFERMAVDEGVGVMTLDGGELPPLSINVGRI